eukprot:1391517-Amorphochlora_amoeboformis.AAC.2
MERATRGRAKRRKREGRHVHDAPAEGWVSIPGGANGEGRGGGAGLGSRFRFGNPTKITGGYVTHKYVYKSICHAYITIRYIRTYHEYTGDPPDTNGLVVDTNL